MCTFIIYCYLVALLFLEIPSRSFNFPSTCLGILIKPNDYSTEDTGDKNPSVLGEMDSLQTFREVERWIITSCSERKVHPES